MDSILASSTFINHDRSNIRQSTNKVLSWLEDNLSTLNGSCECCKSRSSCSFHATSGLSVRGKVLEDRLLKLNKRRQSLEQKNELLEERRRQVIEMALKIRKLSGTSLDGKESDTPSELLTRELCTPDVVPRPLNELSRTSFTDIDEVHPQEETTKSRGGLKTIRSVFKKVSSVVRSRPEMKTITTQTSSSLLTGVVSPQSDVISSQSEVITPQRDVITPQGDVITPQGDVITPQGNVITPQGNVITPAIDCKDTCTSDIDLITQYTKEGLKCTWC